MPPINPHILFLFSDTGGEPRSAAEAIIEALDLEFPGRFSTEMIEFFKEYTPRLLIQHRLLMLTWRIFQTFGVLDTI